MNINFKTQFEVGDVLFIRKLPSFGSKGRRVSDELRQIISEPKSKIKTYQQQITAIEVNIESKLKGNDDLMGEVAFKDGTKITYYLADYLEESGLPHNRLVTYNTSPQIHNHILFILETGYDEDSRNFYPPMFVFAGRTVPEMEDCIDSFAVAMKGWY